MYLIAVDYTPIRGCCRFFGCATWCGALWCKHKFIEMEENHKIREHYIHRVCLFNRNEIYLLGNVSNGRNIDSELYRIVYTQHESHSWKQSYHICKAYVYLCALLFVILYELFCFFYSSTTRWLRSRSAFVARPIHSSRHQQQHHYFNAFIVSIWY